VTDSEPVVRLVLPSGAAASVVDTDGVRAVVLSPAPFPPGATLLGEGGDGCGVYSLKVQRCRREPSPADPPAGGAAPAAAPPRFRVEGRWVNLSRPQRERLLGGSRPDRG